MDLTLEWRLSSRVEELVSTINKARNDLRRFGEEKWGKAKIVGCDVYASAKLIELLGLADEWKDLSEEEDVYTASHVVATIGPLKVHEHEILSNDVVRVIIQLEAGESTLQWLYANVVISNA